MLCNVMYISSTEKNPKKLFDVNKFNFTEIILICLKKGDDKVV